MLDLKRVFSPSIWLWLCFLASCADSTNDGSNSLGPEQVTPQLNVRAAKSLEFRWAGVSSASHYRLLEDLDGVSGFSQVGGDIDAGVESLTHAINFFAHTNSRFIVQSCNQLACTDSAPMLLSQVVNDALRRIAASTAQAHDSFGSSVSLSADGNTLAVGAYGESNDNPGVNPVDDNDAGAVWSGAVYVFTRDSDFSWQIQSYLKASKPGPGDGFGIALSLSAQGNTLAIGAWGEGNSNPGINTADNNADANLSGAVYVFDRSASGVWSQAAYIKSSKPEANDAFGIAVDLSSDGSRLAVGAYREDADSAGVNSGDNNNNAPNSGAAYIFDRSNTGSWAEQATIKASNPQAGDWFGIAISLSGNGRVLAVGARAEDNQWPGVNPDDNNDNATDSGAVYLFTQNADDTWLQQTYLKSSKPEAGDEFGTSLSLNASGTILAVGASGEDSSTPGIDPADADAGALNSGAVYLFAQSATNVWAQTHVVKSSQPGSGDHFGLALSLSANNKTFAVGSSTESNSGSGINPLDSHSNKPDSGAAYVFSRINGIWAQQAYIKSRQPESDDHFGSAISVSADGQTLAVGAIDEGVDASFSSPSGAGSVYVF